jgi:hypothetical protein
MSFAPRALVVFALILSFGCSPMNTQEPFITITPRPRTLAPGQASTISVSAEDGMMKSGKGTVRMTSTAGSLRAGEEASLADGKAEFTLNCPASDSACMGSVRLTAEWSSGGTLITGSSSVTYAVAGVDAGNDAGVDAGVGAGLDAGLDAGATASLTLGTDAGYLVAGVGDTAPFIATLRLNGQPAANELLNFTTTTGLFVLGDGGTSTATSETTRVDGTAQVNLTAGTGVEANLTVVHPPTQATASATISINQVTGISFVNAACASTPMGCSLMGIRGSGFNPTAQLRFRVVDAMNRGVARVPVSFALNSQSPVGTTVSPTGVTDSVGEVTAVVTAGLLTGVFIVNATVVGTAFTAPSNSIGVRGAKPSNKGTSIQCERFTLAAYMSTQPPLPLSMNCSVTLQDRFGNPVGTGTSVFLRTEAGGVPNSAPTEAFSSLGSANEGKGTFMFSTMGTFPPADVDPFPADSAQFPNARLAEPSRGTALLANPRDGFVSVLAYVSGEEYFSDDNSNGVRDTGEQFYDQGEPLVDENDNNTRELGEDYFDANGNNQWDGPNGVWDADTYVWTETRVLYVNLPELEFSPTTFDVPKGGSQTFILNVNDLNLNRPEVGTTFDSTKVGAKGTLVVVSLASPIADGFGFSYDYRRVPATGAGNCDGTNPATRPQICVYKSLFTSWWPRQYGVVRLDGAPTTDMSPEAATTVNATVTTRNLTRTTGVSGIVQ